MTKIFAERSVEKRRDGEALIREADNLACQSWNEKMWCDGGPIDPSPTIDQAINGGFPWLEIKCSRCNTPRDVDLAALRHVPTTCIHDLAGRLACQKCKSVGKRPAATLLQPASLRVTSSRRCPQSLRRDGSGIASSNLRDQPLSVTRGIVIIRNALRWRHSQSNDKRWLRFNHS